MWKEIRQLSLKEKKFVFFAMLCGFLISMEYAILRPACHSIFIHSYGSSLFPLAWLVGLPCNLACVALYHRFLPRIGCLPMFMGTCLCTLLINTLSAVLISSLKEVVFFLFVWKEIYILLMFQQLWSVIHTSVQKERAKYLYGVLFGFGALGGFVGSIVTSLLAKPLGSEALLFATIPIYLALMAAYLCFFKHSEQNRLKQVLETKDVSSLKTSCSLLASSRWLTAIFLMTIFMHLTATLTDFQFHTFLEAHYPDKDIRTAFFGKVLGIGNVLTMLFQFVGTFFFIWFLGLQRAHLFVPVFLMINAALFLTAPSFGVLTYAFLSIKCLEFSLFGVIKEMLYIPLQIVEKFQIKSFIDVFTGRAAKVIASCLILGLQSLLPSFTISFLTWMNVGVFVAWCGLVLALRSYYGEPEGGKVS